MKTTREMLAINVAVLTLFFSSASFAATRIVIEAEISEYKHGGETWDTKYLPGDPAPDVQGVVKAVDGETCEIPLNKDTHIIKQICLFNKSIGKDDAISIFLSDKDVGRPDDVIFSGSVKLTENPTVLENPPNSFLKSLKINFY